MQHLLDVMDNQTSLRDFVRPNVGVVQCET